MRIAFLAAALLAAAATAAPSFPALAQPQAAVDPAADSILTTVLADPRREADRGRDAHRHPVETLEFFGVKPGMTVVDYLPAGGWYTRILVPYLGPQGRYIAMAPDVSRETRPYFLDSMGGLAEKFPAQAAGWNLGSEGAAISAFNVDSYPEALDGTVDIVLSFREMHNQLRFGWLHNDLMAMRRMLKPGGFVGLTDHRANEDAPYAARNGSTGYLRESDVIALMGVYGFELVGKSEVNANPRDTKDYPGGVWTLAPGLRGVTDEIRARIQAIGESDRMTLLFRKLD
jgi:predicted methyltransferase